MNDLRIRQWTINWYISKMIIITNTPPVVKISSGYKTVMYYLELRHRGASDSFQTRLNSQGRQVLIIHPGFPIYIQAFWNFNEHLKKDLKLAGMKLILTWKQQDLSPSVCVYRRISLTTEPICFSFTVQWLFSYVKWRCTTILREDTTTLQRKKIKRKLRVDISGLWQKFRIRHILFVIPPKTKLNLL